MYLPDQKAGDGGDNAIDPSCSMVVLSLIDFNENNSKQFVYDYSNELKDKMRNYRKVIPFSMKFEEFHQINPPNVILYPFDKVCCTHNCICVSDESISLITFLKLETFEFISSFNVQENVSCILIEENYDNQLKLDAIYFGGYEHVSKYRISDLLKEDNSNAKYIWKSNESVSGISIRETIDKQKQLYVFNTLKIRVEIMDPMDGKIIGHFQLGNISIAPDMIFITPNKIIVSELDIKLRNNKCYIFEEVSENNWKLIKEIQEANNVKISRLFGMTIDRVQKVIFLSDNGNHRLITLDSDGNVLSTFQTSPPTAELNPFGLCFDERTGLLYVTDTEYFRVYK